jgi:hypothetical protein
VIAVNLGDEHPVLNVIRTTLEMIRNRPEAANVRIGVHEWPDPRYEEDDDMWIAAEHVVIWASTSPDDVEAWCAPLLLDGVGTAQDSVSRFRGGPEPRDGLTMFVGVWD